jgi:phosphoribosylformylglycinamidine synthase
VADRPRRRQAAPGRFDPGPGACRPRRPAGLRRRCPDLDDPQRLRGFFELIRDARQAGLLLAYHDRSDGGAFAALCEMAFTSRLGLDITLDAWGDDPFRSLFNEELGAVVQIAREDRAAFADLVERHALTECAQRIAKPTTAPVVRVSLAGENLAEWRWESLFDAWWSVTHAMQKRRDNPANADAEREIARAFNAPGLKPKLSFDINEDVAAPFISTGARPRVACCASRASTARSKWPTSSNVPASAPSTCT